MRSRHKPSIRPTSEIIRNGVELPELPSQAERSARRAALEVREGEVLIGCVANYRSVKRLDLLIEAFAAVAAKGYPVKLEIVGEGPLRASLARQIASLGLDGRIRLHGSVLNPEPLYAAFDVVVQASEGEGLPNVLLEGAAAGRAIVATAAGGTGEIVVDGVTGLLVPVNDPGALARALIRVVGDGDLRRRLGAAGRDHVAATFGMEQFVAEFGDLYEELAAVKRLRAPRGSDRPI